MPEGPPPLVLKPWHDPQVHWVERIKWLNGDKMREIMTQRPDLEPLIQFHLQELQMAMMPAPVPGASAEESAGGGGGGVAMANSNKNSASTASLPAGNKQYGPNQGPR